MRSGWSLSDHPDRSALFTAIPYLAEEAFNRNSKAACLRMASPTVVGGDTADIEGSNATKATNSLISLDEEGQAEGARSLGDCLTNFRGITDGIGSQPLMAAQCD